MRYRSPRSDDYARLVKVIKGYLIATYGSEVGDPRKAVEKILDVVKAGGMAAGKGGNMPIILPLGKHGLEVLKGKCEDIVGICREWEDVIGSADI